MDALRTGLLHAADDISLAFQNAGKTFGFLSDGRDLIVISDDGDGRVATLPDHSDEGWPEVQAGLPANAEFVYAAGGWLTRVAKWKVSGPESAVIAELSARTGAPSFKSRAGGGGVASIGSNATLRVRSATSELTILSFEQVRDPEAIREVMRSRATRWQATDSSSPCHRR
jgi:hypothetical protein